MILTQDLRKTVVKGHEDRGEPLIYLIQTTQLELIHKIVTLI